MIYYIEFSGFKSSDAEFSANTYLNTLADINISYQIITDSLPTGWDFQNCFPTCNPINTYFTDVISLKCLNQILKVFIFNNWNRFFKKIKISENNYNFIPCLIFGQFLLLMIIKWMPNLVQTH